MDKQEKILLHTYQNIKSVNADLYNKIELTNKLTEINEYNIRNVINSTEIFDIERNSNEIYRIYGRFEYMSLFNGLKNNYLYLKDFFNPQVSGNSKNIFNSFDFYLVRPASGYTAITGYSATTGTTVWERYFEVIATPNNFEIFPIGFSNNVYNEQAYSFNFNIDFDILNYYDEFNFPLTELFLYAQYKQTVLPNENLSGTTWSISGISTQTIFNLTNLNIGDYVQTSTHKFGNIIEYSKSNFYQNQLFQQEFYIETPYLDGVTPKSLIWKYNPFIPIRLRYFTSDIYYANTGSSSYDLVMSIPPYATQLDNNGNFVWKSISPEGYFDPLTGLGTDNPFINGKRYLFSSIIFDITPDLNDSNTYDIFKDIWFEKNAITSNITPTGDINNIGKPCR